MPRPRTILHDFGLGMLTALPFSFRLSPSISHPSCRCCTMSNGKPLRFERSVEPHGGRVRSRVRWTMILPRSACHGRVERMARNAPCEVMSTTNTRGWMRKPLHKPSCPHPPMGRGCGVYLLDPRARPSPRFPGGEIGEWGCGGCDWTGEAGEVQRRTRTPFRTNVRFELDFGIEERLSDRHGEPRGIHVHVQGMHDAQEEHQDQRCGCERVGPKGRTAADTRDGKRRRERRKGREGADGGRF